MKPHFCVWYRLLIGLITVSFTSLVPLACSRLVADDAQRTGMEFERADIPADRPEAWPKEISHLEEYPRDQFLSLIQQLTDRLRGPRVAWLKSAHYEATLADDRLISGVMTASVQRFPGPPSLLDLGPFSFAFKDLKWPDRLAVWGSSTDGRVCILTDGRGRELLGEWTYQGRRFPGGIDFDLQLPVATTSFLDLRIPPELSVYAAGAEVSLLSKGSANELNLWRIHCGSESRCRVTIVDQTQLAERQRALLVDYDMHVIVREEEIRFQLILNIESLDAPVRELTLRVPTGLKIYSVLYGTETLLSFKQTQDIEEDGRVIINLPGPLTGRGRSLRIEGIAVQKPGQPAVVPQIIVDDSTFTGGRQFVTIQSPLQVRSIRSHGYRQLTPLLPNPDGESFSFQQLTADAQFILDVHRPPVSLSGQLLSLLIAEEDEWKMTTEILWSSPTGGGFRMNCLFPSQWEVTDVQLTSSSEGIRSPVPSDEPARFRENVKWNWEVQPQGGGESHGEGNSLLSVEFMEAMQPGQSRAVKVISQRRSPESGQAVSMPAPQLLNCETTDSFLGIQIPSSMTMDISEDAKLERVAPPTGASFAVATDNRERRWFRGDFTEGIGTMKLSRRLPQVEVHTETTIEAVSSEYRVRYSIRYEPGEVLSDRVLVYLTEPNSDVRWTLKGSPTIDLSASRLKKSQHLEWNLPSKGELWEIRLPRSLGRELQIEGISINRWLNLNRLALIFVPQAFEKQAVLTLTHPDSLEFGVETEGLKPAGQRLTWWYATPDIEFGLSLQNPEPSREFPLMVSMQLRTLMTTDANGFDLYRARLQLENGASHETLRIQLHASAVFEDAFVDGESIAAKPKNGELTIPGLNAGRGDAVDLVYRVPARSNPFYEKRHIIVPQVSAQVLGFSWEFAIPPSARLFTEPSPVRLSRSLPIPSWYQRFFGPLGRADHESVFIPFRMDDWKQLVQPDPSPTLAIGARNDELLAPAEWQQHHATSPSIPDELFVELWHSARIKLLHWICLGVSLLLGLGLRIISWRYRDRVASFVIGLALAGTISAPLPLTESLGGIIVGTLIALLIPRRLFCQDHSSSHPRGTNPLAKMTGIISASLIGGFAFWIMCLALSPHVLIAEELLPNFSDVPKRPTVFVPVDADGQPSETVPLVYLSRDALLRWKEMANNSTIFPKYLISSAKYDLSEAKEGHLTLRVRYQVHLLNSTSGSVFIELPLSDAILPDADSCRVNGLSHPIGALPQGKGYVVELVRPSGESAEVPPVPAGIPRSEARVTTYEIDLQLRKPRPIGAAFELNIPSVARSHFSFDLPASTQFAEITGGLGETVLQPDHSRIECDLGSTTQFQVHWGPSSPLTLSRFASVSLIQHLDLRPSSREIRFHLKATLDEGDLDTLELDLPAEAVVRSIHSRGDDLLRSDIIVTGKGQRRLRLIFDRPHRSSLVLDGILFLPQTDSSVQTPLPRFGLSPSPTVEWRYERNWWGVSGPADFRLETANLDPENVNAISSDVYLNAWNESIDPRHLEMVIPQQTQSTFEVREGITPTFQLLPLQTKRRGLNWKQTGAIGKRRLEWTLVGEMETSSSATFQTVLLVDRRLRIEKISVIENGAERLIRWSEFRGDPSRVVLFLSDKPQAKQIVTLRGSMPLRSGVPVSLPFIRPEDCDIVGSRLLLTRDAEVDVNTEQLREWKTDTDTRHQIDPDQEGQIVVGQFQLSEPIHRGTIQTSSRHSQCSTRAAVFLRRTAGLEWKLTYRMQLKPEGESPLRMGVHFPSGFTDIESVEVEHAEPAWHEQSDGMRQLDLLLNRSDAPGTVILQYETKVAEPKKNDWELPLPIPLNANSQETLLVIEPENVWFPAGGRDLRIADLPEWSQSVYNDLPGGGQAFRVTGSSIRIQRDALVSNPREQSVRLLDQRIWLHQPGNASGMTHAYLSSVRNDLTFHLPPHILISAIFLDDHPLPLSAINDGRMLIPMSDAGTESVLTMAWSITSRHKTRPITQEEFPWPQAIKVERNLITILPDDPLVLWSRSGLTKMNSLDQGLDRLETLLDRQNALGAETRGAILNRAMIQQLQARLLNQTMLEVQKPTSASPQRLARRDQFVADIDQLDPAIEAVPENWQTKLMEEPVTDVSSTLRGQGVEGGIIQVWQLDRRWLQIGFTLLTAVILIPLLRKIIRIEWSDWLQRHVAASWLLLATVWWLFLTPSVLGSILLLTALFRFVIPLKTSRSPS